MRKKSLMCLCLGIFNAAAIWAQDTVEVTEDRVVVTTEIIAAADEVWKLLVDFKNYADWNKWYLLDGEAKVGATIKAFGVNGQKVRHLDLEITKMDGSTLCWTDVSWFTYFGPGGWRCRSIQANEAGRGIQFVNHFEFTGPFRHLLKWYVTSEVLLKRMILENHGLKDFVETKSLGLTDDRLSRAGANRSEIERALATVASDQRESMRFLISNMPDQDLQTLKADYLLENVWLAHRAIDRVAWGKTLPKEIFLNNVLPYASVSERRDDWRKDFIERFAALIKDAKSPGEAAVMLNQNVFELVNVRYSTGRRKADQSALESIQAGTASCTGLSILLIDACRALGIPARFVGTPMWADGSGNHSWVEIWDGSWHFIGAAEPNGDKLDDTWFMTRASQAARDNPRHAIYATSFQRTQLSFPMVWDFSNRSVCAVNVSDRYTRLSETLPDGVARVMFKVTNKLGQRVKASLKITDAAGEQVFGGTSNDESFDANDHVTVKLRIAKTYTVVADLSGASAKATVTPHSGFNLVTMTLESL